MALSDKFRKKSNELAAERERLAVERARSAVKQVMETDQFKLSALALPESQMAVDAIVTNTVSTVLDPVGSMLDTLRARGFRQAEIRSLVHNLYVMYNLGPIGDDVLYEQMERPVAEYLLMHQELYNTFDPEQLRQK